MKNDETALVLFSGGQDSTTCLAWALDRFERVEMLGFAYGQRHAIELDCRDRLLAGIFHDRQKDAQQHRDDADDDQQFDQRESRAKVLHDVSLHHI